MSLVEPIFFTPNRVWRFYCGGFLLDHFLGKSNPEDGHMAEEWLASGQRAVDAPADSDPDEGLSRLADSEDGITLRSILDAQSETLLGQEHVDTYGNDLGLHCKFMDVAVRLPIQCHPDIDALEMLYGQESPAETAKSWTILRTREVEGETPYILLGFKEGITADAFAQAVARQDSALLVDMLHKIPVQTGETFFIPPRMPHTVGPGVLLLETSSAEHPVIRVERACEETELTDEQMWGPLTREQALSVFDCTGSDGNEMLRCCRVQELILQRSDEGYYAEVIGDVHTDAFSLWHVEVVGRMQIRLPRPFGLVVCANGEGRINWVSGSQEIGSGDYFLQPYGTPWVEYTAYGRLSLMIALPPAI